MRKKTQHLDGVLKLAVICICLVLVGCKQNPAPGVSDEPAVTPISSDSFVSTGYKIKATITPQILSTFDPLVFEVYVDGAGNGSGLCGFKDGVYQTYITGNKVFVQVDSNVIVSLSDITGHMIPSSLNLASVSSMEDAGFTVLDGKVSAYNYNNGQIIMNVIYQENPASFEATSLSAGNNMNCISLINYILDYEKTAYIQPDVTSPDVVEERESFYNDAEFGVTIRGVKYSVGDYCNPKTYFEGATPEGIMPSYSWNEDKKVELTHVSYISSDGRSEFVLTDGYVQTIYTTSDFKFLEIYKGMSTVDLKSLLGLSLRKADRENFTPMIEGLEVKTSSANGYILSLGNLTVTIQVNNKDKVVSSLQIENYLDFVKES